MQNVMKTVFFYDSIKIFYKIPSPNAWIFSFFVIS